MLRVPRPFTGDRYRRRGGKRARSTSFAAVVPVAPRRPPACYRYDNIGFDNIQLNKSGTSRPHRAALLSITRRGT